MKRRNYLAVGGTVAGAITGALGHETVGVAAGDEQPEEDQVNEDAGEESKNGDEDDQTATAGQFELVGMEVPDEVAVMTPFTYSYTVANTADEDATFWTYFTVDAFGRAGVAETREGLKIPAGERATVERNTAHAEYLGTVRYHVEAFPASVSFRAVPASRELGEVWRSPEDLTVVVEGIELRDSYEYEDPDGAVVEEPAPERSRWAFVLVRVENVATESRSLPRDRAFKIISDGQQFDRVRVKATDGAYEGCRVEPDTARSGWIAYAVPTGLTTADAVVSYTDGDANGEWTARWAVDSEAAPEAAEGDDDDELGGDEGQ